jgi:hypothetical protein
MSRREGCWDRAVPARRVVSPFAGLWRVSSTRSTPGFRACATRASAAPGAYRAVSLSLSRFRCWCHGYGEVLTGE